MRESQLSKLLFIFIGLSALFCFSGAYASEKTQKLSLMSVLQSIDMHYPQIKIARLEVAKASGAFINAKGQFDPLLEASTRSQPAGGYINNYGDTQLTIPTLYNGVKLFAGYRNGEGNWPSYYQNYLTNSGGEYRAGLSLPLLRDRLIDKDRTGILSSAQLMLMKVHDAEAVKIKIYQEAVKAYWQWVEAGLQLNIFKQLLDLAQKRQHAIEQQANQGDLPRLAISENLQQIIQREQLLNQGQMIFEQAGVNLSLYFRDPKGRPLVPPERSLPALISTSSTIAGTQALLREHPGIKKLGHFANMMKLKRNQARNELLPQLDATAYTFKQNGAGGDPLLIPQAAMVGVSFKFPLFQRQAKGNLIQAESELRQVRVEKRFLYEQLNNEFTNILIGINRSRQQVRLLKKELALAQKVQQGEIKKFYQGDSTLFLVNQREQMTTQVQLNTLHAQAQLEELKARARYFASTHRANGSTQQNK
ncbi:TolC family protein [Legionella anisa]|uniref:TolC family protein n=3 Tax=Legionella anisa TaxID=28082 RepID=A0AAX0WNW2_9GAMM|nr:TolC family protein [Legionella anisa]AWN73089.1 TolC family protein [Legionella anisa]KTC67476.1 outer membrane component of multidrug efflux pump [Legionella anisa]MBN5937275.1 TolC family protein [Legionella anisa]MCW8423919.1 TolC family protein [Legionella anisa]MCW8447441.1 TolC family protein [Legionella anisa]